MFRYHLWAGPEKDSKRNNDKEKRKTNEWKLIEDKEKEKRKRRATEERKKENGRKEDRKDGKETKMQRWAQ